MKITSRLAFSFPAVAIGISVIASSPGPPASQTIGSLFFCGDAAATIATESRIFGALVRCRFSGTMSWPQRAFFNSAIGCGGAGHGPGTKTGVPGGALVVTDALAGSVSRTQTTKAGQSISFI